MRCHGGLDGFAALALYCYKYNDAHPTWADKQRSVLPMTELS
jgi:hypothetical protein